LQHLQIALDAGDQDSLAYDANKLAGVLRARGVSVSLVIGQGGHARTYWRAHTYNYFSFYLEALAPATGEDCFYYLHNHHRC
jgi:hypothetical protein